MLDLIAAMFAGAYCMALVWVLVWVPARTLGIRIALTGAFVTWLVAAIALASTRLLVPSVLGPVPAGLPVFLVALLPLLAAWRSLQRRREPLLDVDPSRLVALHSFRLGGVFFLLLGMLDRLALPFAFIAGLGDIVAGSVALWLTTRRALGHRVSLRAIRAWNAFGMLDLVLALVTATLANPASPIGILGSEPGMRTMTTVPWILVPAVIVPLLFLAHIVIGVRVRALATSDTLPALANA